MLYETLNIASKWSLPSLLVILENNAYAQTWANQTEVLAGRHRASGPGIWGRNPFQGNTWAPDALTELIGRAVRQPYKMSAQAHSLYA